MKGTRHKSVLGIALGERSATLAEVVVNGEQREVRRAGTFAYPAGVTMDRAADLGRALGAHLKEMQFGTRTAIIGLSARRIVTKIKDVPPADRQTTNEMLRLQAEGEFGSDLKDLVFDYAARPDGGTGAGNVLLVATPGSDVTGARAMAEAAGLNLVAVTPAALVLGAQAGRTAGGSCVVVASGPSGVEVMSQQGDQTLAVKHLRSPDSDKAFAGSLRRTILPMRGSAQDLVAWNLPEAGEVGAALGMTVRAGDAGRLGVSGTFDASMASAVAVAASGTDEGGPAVDFAHSKLAAPKEGRIPRWAYTAAALLLIAMLVGFYAYDTLDKRQDEMDRLQSQVAENAPTMKVVTTFNDKVTMARAWHGGDPKYLACLAEITRIFPDDPTMFATNFSLAEPTKPLGGAASGAKKAAPPADGPLLVGHLDGKAGDQRRVQSLLTELKSSRVLTNVQLTGTNSAGRSGEVTFHLTFSYKPPAPTTKPTS